MMKGPRLGDMRADRLHTDDAIIGLTRHDADEAALIARAHGKRGAVGGKGNWPTAKAGPI